MTDTECPTCGDEFNTEKGMKIHHKRVHGESIAGVTVECDWCGDEVTKSRYQIERDEYHFCSRECRAEWRTENFTGENNPAWKGGKVAVECAWCDKELEIIQAKDRAYDVHFCSVECEGQWKSENQSGENAPAWKGGKVDCTCDYCDDEFTRFKSTVEGKSFTFCSANCRLRFHKETASFNPDYGPDWPERRREALEHYGWRCDRCGVGEGEHKDQYGVSLHVHHRRHKDEFDTLEEANQIENLRPLCVHCHMAVEQPTGGYPV